MAKTSGKIKVIKNGPYLVSGNIPIEKETIACDKAWNSIDWKKVKSIKANETYELCRCGHSCGKPFCDNTHKEINFKGEETASMEKYDKLAKKYDGEGITLRDCEELCSSARFCHDSKDSIWSLTKESGNAKAKKKAIGMACKCPSGRLAAIDKKTGKEIEPNFKQSISLLEDPAKRVSGPLWVKGGIEIESSDGKKYEIRNRVTLCRCGKSRNMPFCDSTHVDSGFKDEQS